MLLAWVGGAVLCAQTGSQIVKFTPADAQGYHWATLYAPYTLQIPAGVDAYTGYVEEQSEQMVLHLLPVTGEENETGTLLNTDRVVPVMRVVTSELGIQLQTYGTAVVLRTRGGDAIWNDPAARTVIVPEYSGTKYMWYPGDQKPAEYDILGENWLSNPMSFATHPGFHTNLIGFSVDTPLDANEQAANYVLGFRNGAVGFYEVANGYLLPANRVYLQVAVGNQKPILIHVDTEAEDITALPEIAVEGVQKMYDLLGREITEPHHGQLYIMNGHKYIAE